MPLPPLTPASSPAVAGRNDIIRAATHKGRKSWLSYLRLQQKQLFEIFDRAAKDITATMAAAEVAGLIPPHKRRAIDNAIQRQLGTLKTGGTVNKEMNASLRRGISNTVDQSLKISILAMDAAGVTKNIQIGSSFIGKDGLVRRSNILKEKYIDSAWRKINVKLVDRTIARKFSGFKMSDRIWLIERQSRNAVTAVVNDGILRGRSAAAISRDIRQHLALPDTFRGEALKNYHPGRGVYKSAYKNAMRLARTELNTAFWEATGAYVESKPWLDGWIWWVGNVNACEFCLPNDGVFFPEKEGRPEQPHPQCLCRIDPHIQEDPVPTDSEIEKRATWLKSMSTEN